MTPSEAMRIDENPEDYTVQERKDAKKVLAGVGSLEQDRTAPMKRKMPLPKPKPKMMRGGMANGKEHMYAAGGAVNDGLKALAKVRPDVVAKMMNK